MPGKNKSREGAKTKRAKESGKMTQWNKDMLAVQAWRPELRSQDPK